MTAESQMFSPSKWTCDVLVPFHSEGAELLAAFTHEEWATVHFSDCLTAFQKTPWMDFNHFPLTIHTSVNNADCDVLTAKICIWLILDWCDQGWFCLIFFFSFQNLGWDSGRYSSVCCVLLSCMWCHSDVINLFIWDTWFFSFYVIVLSW